MTDVAGLAIFAIGIVLLISGFNDSQALAPVAGDSNGNMLLLIAGGTCSVVGGLILAIRSRRA